MYKRSENADYKRQLKESIKEEYRTPFRVDYARLLHSSAFRRLQGKTQLFPGIESDFFRNRLTHSLEVTQIAKSISLKLNNEEKHLKKSQIDIDLIEFAALAHDLGHPPFGHNGETALDELSAEYGGFEGNAQTFRILTKIEKKSKQIWGGQPVDPKTHYDYRLGLNLTYRSLASILKYDNKIPEKRPNRLKVEKGYYYFDENIVNDIKKAVCGRLTNNFKTIECAIMDIADDIAYSVYDLEDSLKAGFVNPLDLLSPSNDLIEQIIQKLPSYLTLTINEVKKRLYDLFALFFEENYAIALKDAIDYSENEKITTALSHSYLAANLLSKNGYYRTSFTSNLIKKFISGIKFEYNSSHPELSMVKFEEDILECVESLKQYNYVRVISSSMLRVSEHRGKDIIRYIFEAINKNPKLMPEDFQEIYDAGNEAMKVRTIIDFIAGMTDRYAVEFYCRLYSENPESIFKPF